MSARRLIIVAAAAIAFFVPNAAIAQNTPPPEVISPLRSEPDPNGLNLVDGKKNVDMPVVLSTPADPRLTFDKVQNSAPYVSGFGDGSSLGQDITTANLSYSVHVGADTSESFTCVDGDCQSVTWSGSTLVAPPHIYHRAPGGEQYRFNLLSLDMNSGFRHTVRYYASTVTYPDGEVITFTYNTGVAPGDSSTYYRPTRIGSSTGYYITVAYQNAATDPSQIGWGTPTEAALYAPDGTLIRRLVYTGGTITDYGNSATNVGGRTFTISGFGSGLGGNVETYSASVQLPGESSPELLINQASNGLIIGSINRDAVVWSYSYLNPRYIQTGPTSQAFAYDSLTATGPNGYNVTYQYFLPTVSSPFLVKNRTDALGHVTTYSYESNRGHRLTGITLPEGNALNLIYDDCGNVITKSSVAKPGSGLANISESATYATNDTGGAPEFICPDVNAYRALIHTDALGRVTNYTYNTGGQMTQELAPADPSGVRRETDITYATSLSGLSRATLVRVCGQTTSCAGAAESHTEYTYLGDTNLPLTVMQKDEATGATRVTTYTYDLAGRPTVIDGPLAGSGDAKYFQYDKFGRKIWEVGELAPNNSRFAKKFTYRDSDDKVTNVQTGTVACTTNCHTAALTLTLLQQTDTAYDSRRYPIRETTSKGATTYTVTDRSFLDRGLAECTTVRMSLAALPAATAHGACSLGTQGTQGVDRITKNNYDNAGELLKVQKALLTADQADYVTYTYTANGKQEFVTDANGNKARFVYDGFDRLSQWQFPSKTTPGVVNTADFEQYGYDANGNRTSLRKRDASTLTYTYDNLNRMTVKVVPSRADLMPAQTRDVFYGYDITGRQLFARFDSGVSTSDGVTNTYNGFGDLLTSNLKMGTFTKTLTSAYDGAGRRTQLTHPDAQAFTYAYDNLSRLSGVYQGVGTATPLDTFSYATNGLVSTRGEGATSSSSATYGWDDVNRLTSQADAFLSGTNNVAWTFGYNPASQIVTEIRSNEAYGQAVAQGSTAYVPNGLNQYASVGGTTYAYDTNANLTNDGTNAYTFDIENRLVKAVAGGTTTNLIYDPLGRLFETNQGTSATTTRFLTDGDAMVLELNSSNAVTNRYVHGSNTAADDPLVWYSGSALTTKRWLHADHLGSVVAWTNSTGGSPTINSFDEYGVPALPNSGRFQYTGQAYIPELKLYYYKARFYSPALGRFVQTDPVGYEGGVNLYAYVIDDPVNDNDPTGENPTDDFKDADKKLQQDSKALAQASRDLGRAANASDAARGTANVVANTLKVGMDAAKLGAKTPGYAADTAKGAVSKAVASVVKSISRWLGPGAKLVSTKNGNSTVVSADRNRAFRIDTTQKAPGSGGWTPIAPHMHLEQRNERGVMGPAPGAPDHIPFKSDPSDD